MTFNVEHILSNVATAVSLLGIYQVYRWARAIWERPLVLLGVLPDKDHYIGPMTEGKLGRRESSVEFIFGVGTKKWSACKMGWWRRFKHLETERHHDAIRHLARSPYNTYVLPIILANNGRAVFDDYRLTVRVNEDSGRDSMVKIVDLVTEDAEIASIYADRNSFNAQRAERVTDGRIYELYGRIGLSAHLTVLTGELEPGVYEMIYMQVEVPPGVQQFWLFFDFASPRNLFGVKRFAQLMTIGDGCRVCAKAKKERPAPE